jgi:hypothetical protein
MTGRAVLAASLLAVAAGCGSQSAADSGAAEAGLYGKVVISPATPVCRAGTSCSKPAAHVTLVFSQHGRRVASTRTDRRGAYRIRLATGRYAVRVAGGRRGASVRPAAATVPTARFARVGFTYDPGIR